MTQAELVEFYRSHFLFERALDKSYFMYDLACDAPTELDQAVDSGSWLPSAEKEAKKIHPSSPAEPVDPEPPIRMELTVTAGPKRERSWPASGFTRKASAKRPSPTGTDFGLLGSGVMIKEKPAPPAAIPLNEEQELRAETSALILKLVGDLSPDASPERELQPELPALDPPEPEKQPEPEQAKQPEPTMPEEASEDLFGAEDGEVPDSEAQATPQPTEEPAPTPSPPPPAVLEESSGSEEAAPVLRKKNVYVFNGFSDKTKPMDRQLEIVPQRVRREAAKPKRLLDEMLDEVVLVGEDDNEHFVDKKIVEARERKAEAAAAAANQKPRGPATVSTSQRIALPSEINSQMMNQARFIREKLKDNQIFVAYEDMFRVAVNEAAVALFDDHRKFNAEPVSIFQNIVYQKIGSHLLGNRKPSELLDAIHARLGYSECENGDLRLVKSSWLLQMICWAYQNMQYEEDVNPGSELARLTFSGSRVPELEGTSPVFTYRRSANEHLFSLRIAFWPYLHLRASVSALVAQQMQAVKTIASSAEMTKLLVSKRALAASHFITWVNAVRLVGCGGAMFQDKQE
jgi:hypothetical protein